MCLERLWDTPCGRSFFVDFAIIIGDFTIYIDYFALVKLPCVVIYPKNMFGGNKMKRISVILAFVLCLSVAFCVPVSAAANPQVDLYVKARGTDITVTVKSNTSLGAIQGRVGYDKDGIAYNSAQVNAAIVANNSAANTFHDNAAGVTSVALVGDSASGASGEWATLDYIAPKGTPADFLISNFKAFSNTGAAVTADFTVVMPGDANDDKLVDIKDLMRFKLILSQDAARPAVQKNLNLDNLSAIDKSDMAQLRKDLLDE